MLLLQLSHKATVINVTSNYDYIVIFMEQTNIDYESYIININETPYTLSILTITNTSYNFKKRNWESL